MKPSLSVFLPVKSKMKLMMRVIGIGPIGILTPNSIAFNLCSVWLIDVLVSKVFSGNAYCLSILLYCEFNIFGINFLANNQGKSATLLKDKF